MFRALFLIVPDGFRDEEYSIPKRILEKRGFTVKAASTITGVLTGKKGLISVRVDLLLKEVNPRDYDVLVIVGGQKTFWNNQYILDLIKKMHSDDKVIGAICSSAVLPAQAGLLSGQPGTAFPGPEELLELQKYKVIYRGRPVEVAGRIITASGPEAAEAFALEILRQTEKK